MNFEQKWNLLSQICSQEGVALFDIEGTNGGVLRVYITLPEKTDAQNNSVQHSHCSAVSNRILNHRQVEELLPGNTILEVSSPGVNRKLTRPEHFGSAIGERVKIAYKDEQGKKTSVIGKLSDVTEDKLVVASEPKSKEKTAVPVQILRSQVVEAKVDFKF
jgi:ribosome maturation factor RimP